MHLRRLSLVTFAVPLLFASCSSDSDSRNDGRSPSEPRPNQSADPLQPPGTVDTPDDSPDPTTPGVGSVPGNEGQVGTENRVRVPA